MNPRVHFEPSEGDVQRMIFQWAEWASNAVPELALMYHVPNGGSRDKREARNLKLQGVKAGVPDIVLPVARGEYHGLYIELKVKDNKPTKEQEKWIKRLAEQGYKTAVCWGFESARRTIVDYIMQGGSIDESDREDL